MVTAAVATPLLLADATIDLDRIGARCLAFFAGAGLLLAARSYRHGVARRLLRVGGLACWLWLVGFAVADLSPRGATSGPVGALVLGTVVLGLVCLAAAVATGRGWRSVWWSRRAELAEGLCGSFALASTVVASGFFRSLWEITS
jgi:peptidoglycan/LPS O-acetylase OafA/YrhL